MHPNIRAFRLTAAENAFRQLEADAWGGLDYVTFVDGTERLEFNEKNKLKRLTIFNQRTSSNLQRVSIFVNRQNILVTTVNGSLIEAQIFPTMNLTTWVPNDDLFSLVFYIRVPALGTRRIILLTTKDVKSTTVTQLSSSSNSSM
jgi:hypothetical protein